MAVLSLAFQYLRFNAGRSTLLVLIFSLLMSIPLLTETFSGIAEKQLLARAEATPLVYAPLGSPLDAAMGALFFRGDTEPGLSMEDYDNLFEMDLGLPVPLFQAGAAAGYPVVATNLDYLDFRDLRIADGRTFVQIGDAVLGSEAARRLGLGPGSQLQTDSTRIFELAGAYPVRLNVVGIFEPAGTADDYAVFADLKTGWVAAGLGHGHQDLTEDGSSDVVLTRRDDVVVANARLAEYIEFTDDNRNSFHFHGDPAAFPVSSLLVDPDDPRSAAFLRGRVADTRSGDRQIFRPTDVVESLLQDVFRISAILKVLIAIVTAAALVAIAMVISLSLRLRRREFAVARQVGADRFAVVGQVLAELGIVLVAATGLSAVLVMSSRFWGNEIFNVLFLGMLS